MNQHLKCFLKATMFTVGTGVGIYIAVNSQDVLTSALCYTLAFIVTWFGHLFAEYYLVNEEMFKEMHKCCRETASPTEKIQ